MKRLFVVAILRFSLCLLFLLPALSYFYCYSRKVHPTKSSFHRNDNATPSGRSLGLTKLLTNSHRSTTSEMTGFPNKRPRIDDTSLMSRKRDTMSADGVILTTGPLTDDSSTLDDIVSVLQKRVELMNEYSKKSHPLTNEELDMIITSLKNILSCNENKDCLNVDMDSIRDLLVEVGHLSHKNWKQTAENGARLGNALQLNEISTNPYARQFLHRVLTDGNWDGALHHAISKTKMDDEPKYEQELPWAVLVTGVNGIRKTTSIYQPWFPQLLKEALVTPNGMDQDKLNVPIEFLPCGSNSFFRQLDHMIATLCNEDFTQLYIFARDLLLSLEGQDSTVNEILAKDPPINIIKMYSDLKASIFSRFRTVSELLGAHLLMEAQKKNMNCMVETSGRDVAMFHYLDYMFSLQKCNYRKLALHFTINNLQCAQESVDRRMVHEIKSGIRALEPENNVRTIIQANEGGPYGSEVLPSVQMDSDRVWDELIHTSNNPSDDDHPKSPDRVGSDWYKASIRINAYESKPWTAQAIKSDGSLGTEYIFERS